MQRREFISLFGGAAAAWPLAVRTQQTAMPVIGFLGTGTSSGWSQWTTAFERRLRELGWIEGRSIAIEYRWADGRTERFAEIATELVRLKVDVIVTAGGAVPATKQATSVIPIVFAVAADPLGSGFVASLARPGGNVTGLSLQQTDAGGKRLELLREVVPGLRRLAIMGNVGYRGSVLEMSEVQDTAHTLGLTVIRSDIRRAEDIAAAIEALKGHADALYVVGDPLTDANRIGINTLSLGARLPAVYIAKEYVEVGGLMSYGPNYPDLFKFDLAINLTTAKALGLTIPSTLLARADEVIE